MSMKEQVEPDIKFIQNSQVTSSTATPWMSQETSIIQNPIVRFHNQIIDFTNYIEPTPQQHAIKLQILAQLQQQIKGIMPYALVYAPFLKNKLYLKQTQLQIFIIPPSDTANWQQNSLAIVQKLSQKIGLKIYNLSNEYSEQECRIITEHEKTKIQIWIRFVSQSWKLFISQIDNCVANSSQIRYLYLVIYCMVRQRSLHTAIRSLFIYGICSFFVYERRKQRVRTLTQNIIKFLQFFSIGFVQDKQRKIFYKQGNIYTYIMSSQRSLTFEIAEKVDLAASRKVKELIKIFQNRYRVLGNYYYPPGTSVLAHLINPCFGKFFY